MSKTRRTEEVYDRQPGTCLFCGKEFEDDPEKYPEGLTAETKESIHRAKEHVDADENMSKVPEKRKRSIVETWRAEA